MHGDLLAGNRIKALKFIRTRLCYISLSDSQFGVGKGSINETRFSTYENQGVGGVN